MIIQLQLHKQGYFFIKLSTQLVEAYLDWSIYLLFFLNKKVRVQPNQMKAMEIKYVITLFYFYFSHINNTKPFTFVY